MPRYIDADALYERTVELEATALSQLEKLNCMPFSEMDQDQYIQWRVWSAIYQERGAFKQDVANADTADVVEVVRCKDCIHKYSDRNQIICQKLYFCDGFNFEPSNDAFCSCGERREDG